MRILSIVLLSYTALFVSSCSDSANEASNGLIVQTNSLRYRITDTIRFNVVNSGPSQCQLTSCNATLTYWLQILDQDAWKDRDSINIGPCLAIYGPITLTPGQTFSEKFALATLRAGPTGECRIRTQYMVPGQRILQSLCSNSFELTN